MKEVHVSNVPYEATEKELEGFLDSITYPGAVCFCELKRDSFSTAHKGFGFVTFLEEEIADRVRYICAQQRFQGRWLRINVSKRRITHNPEHSKMRLEATSLYMGCLTEKRFHYLWSSGESVEIEVDFRDRRMHFKLREVGTGATIAQRIEFPFKYIYNVQGAKFLRRRNAPRALLLEAWFAPNIYKDATSSSPDLGVEFDFDSLSLSRHPKQPWVRTVDFTANRSIGQSFAYLLELSELTSNPVLAKVLRNLQDFGLVSPDTLHLELVVGNSCADSSAEALVPLIKCPRHINLSFRLMFRLNNLVQVGNISCTSLRTDFFELLSETAEENSLWVMQKLLNTSTPCDNPRQWLQRELLDIQMGRVRVPKSTSIQLQNGQIWVHRLLVSPTKIFCDGPEPEVSNRVTRQFIDVIDNFIRVSFIEEDGTNLSSQALISEDSSGQSDVCKRVVRVLKEGIWLLGKHYEFLAFSSSQLREQSVWMFAAGNRMTATTIREWMGNFLNIRNVAKCAARMGQCFSSTTKTLVVDRSEVDTNIKDIETQDKKYCFSDGIGMISRSFARRVAAKCGRHGSVPSAFQIRYGGYKGVVAVHRESVEKLSLRPSMKKFDSEHFDLEVISWTKRLPCYLNRQVITLLATLGIRDGVFEEMQDLMLSDLNEVLTNTAVALDVLQMTSSGATHQTTMGMLKAGYNPTSEPYLRSLLDAFRAFQLLQLRTKSRILVSKGRTLMGCLDETGILKYGQVFFRVSSFPGSRNSLDDGLRYEEDGTCVVTGSVVVAKNPCLHPGDVRILQAVDVPQLYHMVDCVVFPQRGHRPHPSECSGSDLDGDLYFVTWDQLLIPLGMDEPMDYSRPVITELSRPVNIEDIEEFFVNYMKSDTLGLIANAHVVHADKEPAMARDFKCLELARLFTEAVDFPKTGRPAVMGSNLRATTYPDFMEKHDKDTYESQRVLGKLFRAVVGEGRGTTRQDALRRDEIIQSFDQELVWPDFQFYIKDACVLKSWYDEKLVALMNQYEIKTEAQALSGNILPSTKFHAKRQADVVERISLAVRSLKSEARRWFKHGYEGQGCDYDEGDDYNGQEYGYDGEGYGYGGEENGHLAGIFARDPNMEVSEKHLEFAKASAWYHVTYHPEYLSNEESFTGDKNSGFLLSFPWVVWDILLAMKRENRSNTPSRR